MKRFIMEVGGNLKLANHGRKWLLLFLTETDGNTWKFCSNVYTQCSLGSKYIIGYLWLNRWEKSAAFCSIIVEHDAALDNTFCTLYRIQRKYDLLQLKVIKIGIVNSTLYFCIESLGKYINPILLELNTITVILSKI